ILRVMGLIMKKDILSRYERNTNGDILIDITADRIEDLFNHFDRSAPYILRDLDQDLVNYIIESAKELDKEPFIIRFTLNSLPDETELSNIRRSINGFFISLVEAEKNKFRQMTRKSFILFCLGIGILFISIWVNQKLGSDRSVMTDVFAEGLTVAAWVSLWEALATFLIKWFPHRTNINLYQRLAKIKSIFRSHLGK
ncbi:hypothetical protein, partial [Sulfurovum sp.]|uniref:hypothetical protein n=1 Tax=Sulfurovum sp. TaxID=1969726 RepID=UPI0035698B84